MDVQAAQERAQDTDAVVELIPALRAFARTFYKDQGEADELVQETLAKAIAKIDQYQHGTRLKSWLFTIMRNTFYNRLVWQKRESPGLEDCVASLPKTQATQDWHIRGLELNNAILRLPPKQREMLLMVTVEGASYIEAAERCRCDIGTVKSRLFRSRARLLKELGCDDAKAAVG